MTTEQTGSTRIGGHLVVETLEALGADVAFGVPGVHALAIWEALRTSSIAVYGARTELCAGFAADGYARSSGRPAPLLLSTGPGALNSLTAVMEAASSHVPVVAISSQIPTELLGRGRGYLHELPDQLASFAPLVKQASRASSAEAIPGVLARAWQVAMTPPCGPVFVEIPVDLLTGETAVPAPGPVQIDVRAARRRCRRRGGGAGCGGAAGHLGGRGRDPRGRAGRAACAGRATRRAGGDDVHGQGSAGGGPSPVGRLRLRRGGLPGPAVRRRRRARRRHRAGRRDDRPVRAAL